MSTISPTLHHHVTNNLYEKKLELHALFMKWREYVIICGTQSLHNHSHEPNSLMSPNSNESGCYYTLLLQRTSYIVPRDQTIQQAGFCH